MNGGKGIITGRLIGTTPSQAEPKFIQWGTGGTAEAITQTALATPANEARTSGTSSQVTTTTTSDTYQVTGSIVSAGSQTIQEVALFDAVGSGSPATGGTMFLRAVHSSQVLALNDSIAYTIKMQLT